MSVDWADAKAILTEVEQLYNRDDDIVYIPQDAKKMTREIEGQYAIYVNDTKDIIKSYVILVAAKLQALLIALCFVGFG
jgi:phosphoglycerate-specific signal transduction histidine kinase